MPQSFRYDYDMDAVRQSRRQAAVGTTNSKSSLRWPQITKMKRISQMTQNRLRNTLDQKGRRFEVPPLRGAKTAPLGMCWYIYIYIFFGGGSFGAAIGVCD